MAAKIKKGDSVIVVAGSEKGKTGAVKAVFPSLNRALVDGVNLTRKFKKNQNGENGQTIERSIHLSNLQCFDASTGKGGKVGFKSTDEGTKVRFFKKSGVVLDV